MPAAERGKAHLAVRSCLESLADEAYRDFQAGLIPGVGEILGVRLPELRTLAKKMAREDFRGYLEEMRDLFPGGEELAYEEIMVEGLVIGYGKMALEERFSWLDCFVPRIRNWAVCDSCCSTYKFMRKEPEASWTYIRKYLDSKEEYEIRFALVCMLNHFVDEVHVDEILEACDNLAHDGYYVKMAAAWLISVCYVRFPDQTELFLQTDRMDTFTHNKAIQKIRESFRVTKEAKDRLLSLKRKSR